MGDTQATSKSKAADTPCPQVGEIQRQVSGNLPQAQGEWSMFRGDVTRSGSAPDGPVALKQAWSYCTGAPIFASLLVQNGVAYIASTDKSVAAIDIQHASVLWRFQGDSAFYSTPIIQQDRLYLGSLDGTISALDTHSGKPVWQTKVQTSGSKIWSSPLIAGNLLLFGLASTLVEKPKLPGQVIALDIRTGQLRWRAFTEPGGAPGSGVWSSPAIDAERQIVYVGTSDPNDGVQALRLADGHLLWHWRSVKQDVSDTDVGAGPLLYTTTQGERRVVVGGKNGYLYSLDAESGKTIWQKRLGEQIFSSPAFASGSLYAIGVTRGEATAFAFNAASGELRWQFALKQMLYSSPVIAGQVLYIVTGNGFGPGDGSVYALNARNGQQLGKTDLQSTGSSTPTLLASWLFVGTHNGELKAFLRQE